MISDPSLRLYPGSGILRVQSFDRGLALVIVTGNARVTEEVHDVSLYVSWRSLLGMAMLDVL